MSLIRKKDSWDGLKRALSNVAQQEVYIGVPEEKNSERGEHITNAELLFIHTNGSPVNHIPPRPVLEPAIEANREKLSGMLKAAANLALDGKESAAREQLEKTGMAGQNIARAWFTDPRNGWPENAPSTYKRKLKKGSTVPRPLIDTGEMRKSITYVVRKKGK